MSISLEIDVFLETPRGSNSVKSLKCGVIALAILDQDSELEAMSGLSTQQS